MLASLAAAMRASCSRRRYFGTCLPLLGVSRVLEGVRVVFLLSLKTMVSSSLELEALPSMGSVTSVIQSLIVFKLATEESLNESGPREAGLWGTVARDKRLVIGMGIPLRRRVVLTAEMLQLRDNRLLPGSRGVDTRKSRVAATTGPFVELVFRLTSYVLSGPSVISISVSPMVSVGVAAGFVNVVTSWFSDCTG